MLRFELKKNIQLVKKNVAKEEDKLNQKFNFTKTNSLRKKLAECLYTSILFVFAKKRNPE